MHYTSSQLALQEYLAQRSETQEDGCRVWTGYVSKAGYGSCKIDGKARPVTHVAYGAWHGPLRPNHQVRTTCRNKLCILADHLVAHPTYKVVPPATTRKRKPRPNTTDGINGEPAEFNPTKDPFA